MRRKDNYITGGGLDRKMGKKSTYIKRDEIHNDSVNN